MGHRTASALGVLAALGLLTACGGGGSGDTETPDGGARPGTSASPAAKSYDPPVKFEDPGAQHIVGGALDDEAWNVRLDGTTAYAVSDGEVRAVSALDGRRLWSVKPQGEPTEDADHGAGSVSRPAFAQIDGERALLAAFAVTAPGSGTTPGRPLVEVTALDPGTGKRLWTTTVERPGSREQGDPVLVGANADTAVIRLGDDRHASSVGVALDTHKAAWTAEGFAAKFVDTGVTVGLADANGATDGGISVQGIGLTDGRPAWTYDSPELLGATPAPVGVGAGLFTADLDPRAYDEQDSTVLLAASTGRPPASFGSARTAGLSSLTCLWDERGTTVCASTARENGRKRVFALDTTWKELWSIEEGDGTDRLVPEISTAWHGAVYGGTENGPVILDARTGEDRAADGGVTPFAVSAYAGLVRTPAAGIEAYRAIG